MAQRPEFSKLKIPYFSGKTSENLTQHFRRLEAEKDAYGWTDETAKKVLAYFLSDKARIWYDNEKRNNGLNEKTWEEIKEAFEARFVTEKDSSAIIAFSSRKQKLTERPMDYFDAMIDLRERLPHEIDEKTLVLYIKRGLLPQPKKIVREQRPKALEALRETLLGAEEALELLTSFEDEEEDEKPPKTKTPGKYHKLEKKMEKIEALLVAKAEQVQLVNTERQDIRGIEKKMEKIGALLATKTDHVQFVDTEKHDINDIVAAINRLTVSHSQGRLCYRCKQPGHFASECVQGNEKKQCLRCGETSHVISECTLKEIERICYTCGNTGHYSRSCALNRNRKDSRGPSPARYRDRSSRDKSRERPQSSQIRCQICDKPGHAALACQDYMKNQKN
nr:PREDICTED: uncharacterized protein LOC109041594 [Bemisia tabaci]